MRVLQMSVALLLMLASASFAVCVAGPVDCGFEGEVCSSADQAIGLVPGDPCKEPLEKFHVGLVCNDIFDAKSQCCGCRKCDVQVKSPTTIEINIQSPVGLQSITPTILENATLYPPPSSSFTLGSTDLVVLTGTKIDPASRSRIELEVCDSHCTRCDPVLTLVVREEGRPVRDTITQVPQRERLVTVYNGNPGLKTLHVTANGQNFKIAGLRDNEERTLDIAAAMLAGDQNVITLAGTGRPGGNATVLIHD